MPLNFKLFHFIYFSVLEYEILERPRKRRRRNSDSNLYYKARKEEVEQTDNQPEGGAELDFEKLMLADNYLPNIHETRSVTTETSDSGVRALGAISEGEMKDTSGNYFILVTAFQSPKGLVGS